MVAAVGGGGGVEPPGGRQVDAAQAISFHHLHLIGTPAFTADHYARLFDPATTRRTVWNGLEGVTSDGVFLLISRGVADEERASALWRYGWGKVSLDESYRSHNANEVRWDVPLPGLAVGWHAHLKSRDPAAAAEWYRQRLSARIEIAARRAPIARLPGAGDEANLLPEALVHFGRFSLVIYPAGDAPLIDSRGGTMDHLAFDCGDVFDAVLARLRAGGAGLLAAPAPLGDRRSAMIQGPDAVAIELVGR
jgi:hypothetical protein